MSKFPPNHYQEDILDWVMNGTGNAVVNAKAGTGKTSTLELIAENYPNKMLFLAFNNHIAAEINNKPDLQPYLTKKEQGGKATLKVMTTNALGNAAILEDLRRRDMPYKKEGYLNANKLIQILGRIIRSYCATRNEIITDDMLWAMQKDLKTACDKARSKYISGDEEAIARVIEEDNLCKFNILSKDSDLDLNIKFPELPWAKIGEEALDVSMEMYEERGDYDFVEQLYIPVVKKLPLPAWMAWYSSFVGVDEAQDFSKLQLAFIKKLIPMKLPAKFGVKKPTRFLFVGDEAQSIYAFAGADCHSIDNIKRQFHPKELDLNICYRCAKQIITMAQKDVPTIEAAPNAPEGEVLYIKNEEIADLIQPRRYGYS